MQVAINHQNINFDLFSMFSNFLKSVIENYRFKHKTYNLEKNINKMINSILFLNDNIELILNIPEFEELEDELIDIKFFLEKELDNLPTELKNPLEKLYEALSLLLFNISMYDMKNEVKNIRNQAMQKTLL